MEPKKDQSKSNVTFSKYYNLSEEHCYIDDYLLILIGCHGNEVALLEDVGAEGGVGQLHDVAGSHQVEPGLVLVHRVQDGLQWFRWLLSIFCPKI